MKSGFAAHSRPGEQDLALKPTEALAGHFQQDAYHDNSQERIHELIEASKPAKR